MLYLSDDPEGLVRECHIKAGEPYMLLQFTRKEGAVGYDVVNI